MVNQTLTDWAGESLHRLAAGPADHGQLNGLIGVGEKPEDSPARGDQLHGDIGVALYPGAQRLFGLLEVHAVGPEVAHGYRQDRRALRSGAPCIAWRSAASSAGEPSMTTAMQPFRDRVG
jgi:hypothetical protein